MGGKLSKRETGNKTRDNQTPPSEQQNCDDESVNRLRRDLMHKPEKFLLNNILMSVQFYENFDREMQEFRDNHVSEREIELNRALAGHQKHCVLPDTVTESVNERVRFRPVHGPKKLESEPLLPQRVFIVHDNIEVLAEGETDDYSTVDGPVHRAISEFADRDGYIRLRQLEFLDLKGENGTADSDSDDDKAKTVAFNLPSTVQNGFPVQNGSISNSPVQNSPSWHQSPLNNDSSTPPQTPGAKQRIFEKRDSALSTPTPNKDKSFFQELNNDGTRRFSETRKVSLKDRIFRSRSMSFKNSSAQKLKPTNSAENINKPSGSASQDSESEYDYTTVRRLTEPKPLNEVRANRDLVDMSSISSHCITEVKVRKLWTEDDSDDEPPPVRENGRRRPPPITKKKELFEVKRYFNSVEFFKHFGDVFESIYSTLGFSHTAYSDAIAQGGVIHCTVKNVNDRKIYYEVIPTIATTFPPIALEWYLRKRPVITNLLTNVRYQWPTKNMIAKIQKLNANIFPLGFVPKRGVNECHALEWSLSFPAAERFMFACMSHSQVRCFLFILALYKTFMVPPNTELGLAPHHIRTVMFWECENNYLTWPEDRLGTKMLQVLQNLYRYLGKGNLPDYFVRERNLFETCLSKNLRYSQQKLNQIRERPVVHVLLALRNLRYTSGTFFPTLDFKTLYKIITENDSLALVNPVLSRMVQNNTEDEEYEEPNEFKENEMSFWSREQKRDQEREWKKKARKQLEHERKEDEKLKRSRRGSVDSIDLQVTVPKLDEIRSGVLVKFFIIHFIEVSKKCMDYEAFQDAMVLLHHCRYLAILLDENPSTKAEARQYMERVAGLLDKCEHMRSRLEVSGQNTINNVKHLPEEAPKKKKTRPGNLKFAADMHGQESKSPKRVVFENGDALNESSEL